MKSLKKCKANIESYHIPLDKVDWFSFSYLEQPQINFKVTEVGENILVWITMEEIAKVGIFLVDAEEKLREAVRDQYGLKIVSPWYADAFTYQYYAKAEWDEDG